MIEKTVKIRSKLGFHARAAAMFAKEAERFSSTVELEKNGIRVNAKSIIGILMIVAPFGTDLKILVEGPDERECVEALERLIENGFQERDA